MSASRCCAGAVPVELARKFEEHAKGMVVRHPVEEFGFNYIGPIDGTISIR